MHGQYPSAAGRFGTWFAFGMVLSYGRVALRDGLRPAAYDADRWSTEWPGVTDQPRDGVLADAFGRRA